MMDKKNYIPTAEDIIKSRIKTVGIIKNTVNIDGINYEVSDVGGQKSERKKWLQCNFLFS